MTPAIPVYNPTVIFRKIQGLAVPVTRIIPSLMQGRPGLRVFATVLVTVIIVIAVFVSAGPEKPADYAARQMESRARRIAELAGAVETLSYQFIANPSLNDNLSGYGTSSEFYDINSWNSVFSDFLEGMKRVVPELEEAVFFDIDDTGRKPMTMTEGPTRAELASLQNRVFASALAAGGKAVWIGPAAETVPGTAAPVSASTRARESIQCSRLIKRPTDGSPLGVLCLILDPARFGRAVSGGIEDEGSDGTRAGTLPKGAFSILLDGDFRILGSQAQGLAGLQLSAVAEGWSEGSLRAGESRTGQIRIRIRNGKTLRPGTLVFERIPESDWTLATILPPDSSSLLPVLLKTFLVVMAAGLGFLAVVNLPSRMPMNGELADDKAPGTSATAEKEEVSRDPPAWFVQLAPREQRILLMLASGMSNKEIAARLDLREQTVKNYIRGIYAAIGVQDRVSATLLVEHSGASAMQDSGEKRQI